VSQDDQTDPDRAAILARRRRFIALAISGLATGGCKSPPQPCLNMAMPEHDSGEPNATGPIVEDPGQPIEDSTSDTGETGEAEAGDTSEAPAEPNPQPCLRVKPQACLKMKPKPQPCLMMMDRS
jgi:hypothetical protein